MWFGPYPYQPFKKPVPVPSTEPTDDPLICIRFNAHWLPYVLGALPALTDRLTWEGSDAQKTLAVQQSENLIGLFKLGVCPVITDIRIVDCNLEVQYDELGWVSIGSLAACAAPGPAGPQGETGPQGNPGLDGADGINGQDGADGINGQDGADGAQGPTGATGATGAQGPEGPTGPTGPQGPEGQEGSDTPPAFLAQDETANQNACALALGTADFIIGKGIATLEVIKATLQAGKSIADAITDVMEVVPIVGPLIAAAIDLATDMATKGDFDDVIGFWFDPDFHNGVAEQLYCVFKMYTTIEADVVFLGMQAVSQWAGILPPGLPLVTLYGQVFVLYLAILDPQYVYKRTYVYQNNLSDDCVNFELCDEFCYKYDFEQGQQGWEVVLQGGAGNGGSYVATEGFVANTQPSGTFQRISIGLQQLLHGATVSQIEINGHNPASFASVYIQGFGAAIIAQGNDSSITGDFHRVFGALNLTADNFDYIVFDTPQGAFLTIKSIVFRGPLSNPFGSDNCV